MLRGLAKGARRERAPFSGGFEALTRGEISAILKSGSDLATLTEWDLQEVYWSTRRSLFAHRAGMYLIDLVRHAITDEDPHSGLWDAIDACLMSLPATEDYAQVLQMQWALLVETGYRPRLDVDVRTGESLPEGLPAYGFSAKDGGLVADPGKNDWDSVWRVRGDTVEVLRQIDGQEPDWSDRGMIPSRSVERASRLLAAVLSEVVQRELPSRDALYGTDGGGAVSHRG